jgi:hypothetical protein
VAFLLLINGGFLRRSLALGMAVIVEISFPTLLLPTFIWDIPLHLPAGKFLRDKPERVPDRRGGRCLSAAA